MMQLITSSRTSLLYKTCKRTLHKWHQPTGTDTGIQVYNCTVKDKVPVILKDNVATWYSCGPTVYDSAHIGHATCYVKLDIIQRILINYFNINVITSMGVTDIDDKIINKSKSSGKDIQTITKLYEAEFWKNLNELNVLQPNIITRVSDHVPIIITFIEELFKKEMCYTGKDNSVYFDTNAYGKYGKLQKNIESEEVSVIKKTLSDFALWKAHKEGEPYWNASFGNGRPGWHIECSAMVSRLFGKTVDFHAGGIDLLFPHHENEEAQSCAFHSNDQWVNYWIHTGHLHYNNTKMSKSLNNTISINDLLSSQSSESFRMTCLLSHYRYPMDYSDSIFINAKGILDKMKYFIKNCNQFTNNGRLNVSQDLELLKLLESTKLSVDVALRNDFETSKCITYILKLVKEAEKIIKSNNEDKNGDYTYLPKGIILTVEYLKSIFNVFGINLEKNHSIKAKIENELIDEVVNFRQRIRLQALKSKDVGLLQECDKMRDLLKTHKIHVNDQPKAEALWIMKD